jgi:hypothetical protein
MKLSTARRRAHGLPGIGGGRLDQAMTPASIGNRERFSDSLAKPQITRPNEIMGL